jgi:hypothetical protein
VDIKVNFNTDKDRLGTVIRRKDIPFQDFLIKECQRRNIELMYDKEDIESERELLIFTEFFGGMGGVMIKPQNFTRQMKQYHQAFLDDTPVKIDFSKLIDSAGDKYFLDETEEFSDKVVLLCGSNMLGTHTKKELIDDAVKQGAMLKPHPVTTEDVLELLERTWKNKVYGPMQSGFNFYKNAKEVWTTRFSEFSLFSILEEKKLHFIDNDLIVQRGSYKSINLYLEITGNQNKEGLNKILNSNLSGIFFSEFNTEADIVRYLDNFEQNILGR